LRWPTAVDSIRRFCLSFPETAENLQRGETLCFEVRGKLFALLSLDAVPPTVCCKASSGQFAELLECEGIVAAPYVGRYKWVDRAPGRAATPPNWKT
jgi:predicted DNA-binding protein (MmcQ/YjbR family)